MAKQKDHKVGVYARLSKEDERAGESVSIENQVLMLTAHVKSQGWELVEVYRDDGFSGTNQNRPALQSMLADVRNGRINTLLIKDAYVKHGLKIRKRFLICGSILPPYNKPTPQQPAAPYADAVCSSIP